MIEKYLSLVSSQLEKCTHTSDKYNFRCNICGDSKRSKRKKRAFLFKKGNDWLFTCHNQCGTTSAKKWLKEYFPDYYSQYVRDLLMEKDTHKEQKNVEEIVAEINLEEERKKTKDYYKDCDFVSIMAKTDNKIINDAVKFCEERKLLPEVWNKFLVCVKGKLLGRVIIPFYNKDGVMEYFTARSLYEHQSPKYIMMIGQKKIYNWNFLDKTKPVICMEGPLDSGFVENSIALSGLSISSEYKTEFKKLDVYYIFDNDEPGLKISRKFLEKEKNVFCWKKFLTDKSMNYLPIKDINDFVKIELTNKKYDFKFFEPYFTSNRMDEIYFI